MPHAQVEALEESLRHERRSAAEKEARNKLNVDRLRRQIAQLQVRARGRSTARFTCIHVLVSFISLTPEALAVRRAVNHVSVIASGSRAREQDSQDFSDVHLSLSL